jgi:hypothetical protein
MYIITAKRMISGEVLKYLNGFLIRGRYETNHSDSSRFPLTMLTAVLYASSKMATS